MILAGETGVLGEKRYTASVVDELMSMEHWWNDTGRRNRRIGRSTCYGATLSTANPTWIGLGSNGSQNFLTD
jgi:hypothetical protein